MHYRRLYIDEGCYFFTLVTYERKKIFRDINNIQLLRRVFRHVMRAHPFQIHAFVLLPDHLHCIWELPKNDNDFSIRWRLIKAKFSRLCRKKQKNETTIWQKRFWEHWLRNEKDFRMHMDYIHYNPVKHGYVHSPKQWQYSSFMTHVKKGNYHINWGDGPEGDKFDIEPE